MDRVIGAAGESLQREYDRRASSRRERIRLEHRYLGGLIVAITSAPQSTTSFKTGAVGEQRAARKIVRGAGAEVLFLLNRSLGLGRHGGDIDILAVGPAGVYVVDVKRYPGATVVLQRSGHFRSPSERLLVRGFDKTSLLDSLSRQVLAVRSALDGHPYGRDIPVRAAFCFVDARLPLLTQQVSGVPLFGVRGTTKLVSTLGPLGAAARADIQGVLADALPAAS